MKKQSTAKQISQNENLSRKLAQNQKQHWTSSQIAHYMDLSKVEESKIFTRIQIPSQSNIVFKYDPLNYKSQIENLIGYYIIRTLNDELPKIKYMFCIVYHNNTVSDFIKFKQIMETLPQSYFLRLKNIYVLQSSFLIKILQYFSFNSVSKLVDKLTVYTQSMKQIQQISQRISVQKEKSGLAIQKKQQIKQFNSNKLSPQTIKIIKNQIYGKKIQQYQIFSENIKTPSLIWRCLKSLAINKELLKSEGIFRKSCDLQQLQQLQKQVIEKKYINIEKPQNVNVLCGLIKKLFNNLQIPLFAHKIYKQVFDFKSNNEDEQLNFVKKIISEMGEINKQTYLILSSFFVKKINYYESFNKMNSYNLAVVFGPCFFRPIEYKIEDLFSSGKFSRIILITLKYFNQIDQQYHYRYSEIIDDILS